MKPILFVFAGSLLALSFCCYLVRWILKQPEGNAEMKRIAHYVSEGARGYLKQQYKVVSIFFVVGFILLLTMALNGYLAIFVPFALSPEVFGLLYVDG